MNIHAGIFELREQLESLKIEEEEYRDNMPENMMEGERFKRADDAVEALEEAMSEVDSALESMSAAVNV